MLKLYDVETARNTILRRDIAAAENYPPALLDRLTGIFGPGTRPQDAVAQILESVRAEGDAALRRWSGILDDVIPETFKVSTSELASGFANLAPQLREAMTFAAERIRAFHSRQPLPSWTSTDLGGTVGQRISPIDRVGVYVPGGTAPLPSSLLMAVIPAQVAGVERIVVCTPPGAHQVILGAAHLCGIEEVYRVGGAQAVAAMAFGTESVPRVDKIVGAGGLFVTLAKQQVYGLVGLDGLAGPTETMIIADHTAQPAWLAADLLAQAEHDPLSSAILLTPDRSVAEKTVENVALQIENLTRREIVEQALARRSGVVFTPDLETAAQLANAYGAEHLCLVVADPSALAEQIRHAGGFFLGERSFEVLGDYVAGPSHVMPTGGTARFASPLNLLDFVKINSIVALDAETCQRLSPIAAEIARAETLTAHAAAAEIRMERNQDA
jgi:histidinol dehydrogenase